MKKRFGNQDQRERYRAELKAIRREEGATLQSVYSEVRRIMALAFPGERGTVWEVLARDTFLAALRDESLRRSILEKDPPTLDATLKIACHLEAIARPSAESTFDDSGRRRDRLARGASADETETARTAQRLRQLEATLDTYRRELDRCRGEITLLRQTGPSQPTPTNWTPPAAWPPTSAPSFAPVPTYQETVYRRPEPTHHLNPPSEPVVPVVPVVPVGPPTSSPSAAAPDNHYGAAGRRKAAGGACFGCGLPGHRVKECPTKYRAAGTMGRSQLSKGPTSSSMFAVRGVIVCLIRGVRGPWCPGNWYPLPP